jgi:predicted metal-dependent hydrolase
VRRHTEEAGEARAAFRVRVETWAGRLKVRPKRVRIQRMTSKWASCSTKGWVSFAEDLLREPKGFQDYVIVHELLHLRLPNHGKLFKSLLSAYVPNAKRFGEARSYEPLRRA